MKSNYDQLIWEACGSPTKYFCGNCENYKNNLMVCETCLVCETCCFNLVEHPVDIALAHVMQLLRPLNVYIRWKKDGLVFRRAYITNDGFRYRYPDISWKLLKENNEAAYFADQSDEIKEAICKDLNLI